MKQQILNLDQRELARLRKVYPLFTFSLENQNLTVKMSSHTTYYCTIKNGSIERESSYYLDHQHLESSLSHNLMTLYPDLHIHVYISNIECYVDCWVERDNSDAEAIGGIDILSPDLHPTLSHFQVEAHLAKQSNYFFCSAHQRAEPLTSYSYFHFAGKYCKEWATTHPDQYKVAINESYD